ncbi:MAG: hypothetical protein M3342_14250 [Bacteroidota bacterium]|nr:hypothetical protein [Flavisolibacter sp.]MBD0364638.1 hypothetical protein [Flavisolibacter sp.]MDQ3845153.1 hypothetical protein [Bacteroidota bacterium]
MDLMMFIDGNHISSITINPLRIKTPGYLTCLKQELLEQNSEIVEASTEEPQFFVDGVPSSMNFFASFDADQLINQVLYPRRNKNKE